VVNQCLHIDRLSVGIRVRHISTSNVQVPPLYE
jgi:hypothetical protein